MDLCVDESPAAKALGPLFKLTEVHLWDDGSSGVSESSYDQEHIKLVSCDRDCESNDYARTNGFSGLGLWPEDVDVELVKQMNDLGLPFAFRTNKERSYGTTSGKRKSSRSRKSNQQSCIGINNMPDSVKGSEEESRSPASVLITSEMLDQSDRLKNEIVAETGCLPNLSLQQEDSLSSIDASFGGISGLDNNILYDAESIPCTNEMVATGVGLDCGTSKANCLGNEVAGCHRKEINGELKSKYPHQEISLLMDRRADDQSNDIDSEVMKDLDVAPYAQISEQGDARMIYGCGEWMAYWDDFHMRTYFYNVATQESTWDPPPGMEHLVYSNVDDETTSSVPGLSELDNDEMDISICEEVHASCDPQLIHANDADSLSQQLDEISGDWVSAGNVSSTYTSNKKKKAKKTSKRTRKLSILNEDHPGVQDELHSSLSKFPDVPPASISKYWWQRYLLFSRFDDGIKMDEEGWFSVTPETLAKHHAERCGHGAIVDCFTGVGGNAIQFAKRSRHVIAIDIDPIKIDYARHNAALYGVDDRIDFIKGDSFSLAPELKADTVFLSPPWGGPDYSKVTKFDINSMLKPRDGKSLFDAVKRISPKIVMFLPKNVDINQLAELSLSVVPPWSLEVEKNYLNDRLKAVTAYFCDPSMS